MKHFIREQLFLEGISNGFYKVLDTIYNIGTLDIWFSLPIFNGKNVKEE
jgi:hypothetical protein